MTHTPLLPEHGGPDDGPAAAFDFSTNASPLGPPPALRAAVQAADRCRYPDPGYRALRRGLGDEDLVLPTAGGAEGIRRLTLAAMLAGRREVWVPQPGFGDYALAAQALGLSVRPYAVPADIRPTAPAVVWICEPCNPTGASVAAWPKLEALVIVDRAYEPLRLQGVAPVPPADAWQLVCPNKALGLTGIRAGYVIAPQADEVWAFLKQYTLPSTTAARPPASALSGVPITVAYAEGLIRLGGLREEAAVEVTDIRGGRIAAGETRQHRFAFAGPSRGVYLVTVRGAGRAAARKIFLP